MGAKDSNSYSIGKTKVTIKADYIVKEEDVNGIIKKIKQLYCEELNQGFTCKE